MKILARGPWPHLPTHLSTGVGTGRIITRVIRTDDELAKAAGSGALITAARAFKLAAIDFGKHMVVAIEDGTQPMVGVSGGGPPSAPYAISIVRVDRDEAGKITIDWRRLPRAMDQILTRPLEAVVVPRSDAEVNFIARPACEGGTSGRQRDGTPRTCLVAGWVAPGGSAKDVVSPQRGRTD